MTAIQFAATQFVKLFEFLRDAFGAAVALVDSRLMAARRDYLQEKMVCALC